MQWIALRLGDGRYSAVPYPWRETDDGITDWTQLVLLLGHSVTTTDDMAVVSARTKADAVRLAERAFEEPEEDEPAPAPVASRRVTPERIQQVEEAMAVADGSVRKAALLLSIPESTLRDYLARPELRHWKILKRERSGYLA